MQYLCCELADLQERQQLPPLTVYQVAHVAWRMKVSLELTAAITSFDKVRSQTGWL